MDEIEIVSKSRWLLWCWLVVLLVERGKCPALVRHGHRELMIEEQIAAD